MPRRPRDIAPGYHHVWVNATGGSEYFTDGIDRIAWIRSFLRVLNRMGWTCPGFCVRPPGRPKGSGRRK